MIYINFMNADEMVRERKKTVKLKLNIARRLSVLSCVFFVLFRIAHFQLSLHASLV
jgi:hypothetical protein